MLDCILISSDEGFRHAVMGIIRQSKNQARLALDLQMYGEALNRDTLTRVLQAKPTVVFLDLGPDASGVGPVQILSQEAPDLSLIVGGPALSAEGLLAIMRAGASEYLPRPFSQEEAQEAFARVRRRAKAHSTDRPDSIGRVATVFSAKGGTGVTSVATNLAVALRMVTEKRVLLLDLTPTLGTAAVAMGVQPRYTYLDVVQNFHRLDEELLHSFMEVDDLGVHVLASPLTQSGLHELSTEEVQSLVDLCRRYFDYVVVDGGTVLSSRLDALLADSDDRLMVVTPDLPALRNVRKALDLHGRTNGKVPPHLVLNQYKEGMGLTSKDVEDGLGHRLTLLLDRDDPRLMESVNVGRPEVRIGKSSFSKKLMDFATKMAGADAKTTPPKGLFGWLKRASDARAESPESDKEKA